VRKPDVTDIELIGILADFLGLLSYKAVNIPEVTIILATVAHLRKAICSTVVSQIAAKVLLAPSQLRRRKNYFEKAGFDPSHRTDGSMSAFECAGGRCKV